MIHIVLDSEPGVDFSIVCWLFFFNFMIIHWRVYLFVLRIMNVLCFS